jgi:hypothetical protein
MYRLFYLSWMISNRAGKMHCQSVFSLQSLQGDAASRCALEALYEITLEGLQYKDAEVLPTELDFPTLEAEVTAAFASHQGSFC